jgi:midasin
LVSKCPESTAEVQEDDLDNYILRDYRIVRDFTYLLNIDAILLALDQVLLHFVWFGEDLQRNLRRVLPFLNVYMGLVKDQLVTHNQWTKALFKLNYVLCSVMHTLSTQGFCKPPDVGDTEPGGDTSETIGGVGLGEGTGSENVSKDIEDESQVEGLQGDDAEGQDPKDNKDDGDAIEMSEDIGGTMNDVPETESQDEADSDQESDVDPEEKLGSLDAFDPSAVDEKLWGDEKGPEGDQRDEKTTKDHSEEQSSNSDVVAKEGKEQSKQEDKGTGDKDKGEEATSDAEDHPVPEGMEEEEGDDPGVSGAPMDDHVQDANTLDLPDDMDIGGDEIDLGGEDIQDDMDAEGEDATMEDVEPETTTDDTTNDQRIQEESIPEDIPGPTDQDQDMDAPGQAQETEGDDDEVADEILGEEAIARPDISAGDGTTSMEEPHNPEAGESASTGQTGSTEGAAGKDAASEQKIKNSDG